MSRFQAPAQNSLAMALPLSRSLPALLKQYWYIKRGERVRVRGHAPFYATLEYSFSSNPREKGGCRLTRSCQGNRLGIGLMRSNRVRARTIPKGLRPPAQGC